MAPALRADFAFRVEVALPLPLDTVFDYGVPAALARRAETGRRVQVPFGSRRLVGLIVGTGPPEPRPPATRLRAIERVVDDEPVIGADMIRILREAAHDVFCPVGMALATALPSGSAPRSAAGLALTPRGRFALESTAVRSDARPVLEALENAPLSRRALERRFPRSKAVFDALRKDGLVQPTQVTTGRAVQAPTVRFARIAEGVDDAAVATAMEGPLMRAPRQAAVVAHLARAGPTPTPALERAVPGAAGPLRALIKRGLVSIDTRAVERAPAASHLADTGAVPPTLSDAQASALEVIAKAIRARSSESFLLHGVTGSGKTEVYLRAIAETLALGRQVLVLVPEITLTHQLVARLEARFGNEVAVLHSALRPGERIAEWRRLLSGRTPIGVGARSALFAPLDDLGLIVIDEEHEPAYKNEEGFRYHARDLAARRAEASGCPLVLGSATPALESRHAAERGELRRLVLPHRIGGRPLPAVEIVDLEAARASSPRGRRVVLSTPLRRAIGETLRDGAQSILFLNRRGFSTRIFCFDCGHAERCQHCDISLVFHAPEHCLRCHYCDYETAPPDHCSSCGAPETALLGIGTQRLQEEVRRAFPEARIARLDRDTSARRGETERVLAELAAGNVDILIGTQMVAKGHHFPGVRLVGVVAADLTLHFPDFRAAERTFQLLTQVAGRAGRGAAPGRVIVQTFVPGHYAIEPVKTHDYEAFYASEIRYRRALGYPPFGRVVHTLVSGSDLAETEAAATALANVARAAAGLPPVQPPTGDAPAQGDEAPGPGGEAPAAPDLASEPAALEVLGPAPSPIARIRDRHRLQILVKGTDAERVVAVGRALAQAAADLAGGDIRAAVDPNPINML